jgi:ParB family chromosome partitioning protein
VVTFDALKEFDVAELGRNAPAPVGKPLDLPLQKIYPDPDNIRTSCDEASIAELAQTIQVDGLLQAITVRKHPEKDGCFLISYGERRWRAFRLLGRASIPAVIDHDFDPYRQAIENLQREEMTPIQLAQFVAKREAAGDSRTTIAKRMGKSKSFISELAHLASAPTAVRDAFESGRIDTRTAYLLTRHYRDLPDTVTGWLAGDTPLTRHEVTSALLTSRGSLQAAGSDGSPAARATKDQSKTYNALAVSAGGRNGHMSLQPGKLPHQATVRFADGSQETVALSKITLLKWVRV